MRPACRNCGQQHDPYVACPPRSTRSGSAAPAEASLSGKVLADRYRVGDVLGTGMTGTVYAVEHLSFARPAVVKIVRARHAAPDLVTRVFHGDALTAWGLAHPSLTEVFDIGQLPDGTPFYVMERLDGETLATRVARERLSLAAGIDMMMQLLSAIVALHAREILLRDLRPCNVFLVHRRGCRPLVKLLDVGLARLSPLDRLQEQWTNAGPQPSGHPHYLSPERARGEHLVEAASDIFVAGAIFYEALAAERAFGGASWRTILDQVTRGEPMPLHEKRSDIPVELSQFVSRCMAANPRQRPATAKEMQDELRAIFEDARKASVSIYAPPPSIARRPPALAPGAVGRIAAEPYSDDTETRKSPRSQRATDGAPPLPPPSAPAPIPRSEPHPALLDEMEQTLERIDNPNAKTAKLPALGTDVPEEDETETTRMSPELRARIDQLMRPQAAPRKK